MLTVGATLASLDVQAANLYWDINGTNAGAGGSSPSGSWDTTTANWNTSSAGTAAAGVWADGNTAVFSAGSDATGSYGITLTGTESPAGVIFEDGTGTLTGGTLLLTGAGTISVNPTIKGIIASPITGTVGLTKAGAGELVLQANNSFSGGLTLQRGTLTLDSDLAASAGAITNSNGGGTGGAAAFHSTKNLTTLANNLNLGAANGNNLEFDADSGNQIVLNGLISGSHSWVVNGPGTIVLGGAAPNTFISTITIAQGTLLVTKDAALGTAGSSGNGTVVNSGGALAIAGGFEYFAPEAVTVSGSGAASDGAVKNVSGNNFFDGAVTLAAAASLGSASGSLGFNLPVSGSFPLTKVGSGIIDLFAQNNNYTTTLVSQGTLGVWYPANAGTGLATVNAGARLEGNGSVPGGIDLSGTISPGNIGIAPNLLDSGSQTWHGGATYEWKLNSVNGAAGGDINGYGWDDLVISGGLTVSSTSASRFNLSITSIALDNTAGPVADFDYTQEYNWTNLSTSAGITGFSANKFNLDDSAFVNSKGGGRFLLFTSGNNLVLRFDPAPIITVCTNIVVANDPGACGALVNFSIVATDNQPGVTYSYSTGGSPVTSPANFNVGTATVTAVATDSVGNTATNSFTVTVKDVQAPTIAVSPNLVVTNDVGVCGATVTYIAPVVGDNCAVLSTVQTAGQASGTVFPVGVTTNVFVVTDIHGNTATNSFTVTVNDVEKPVVVTRNLVKNFTGSLITITPADIDNGSHDNCSSVTLLSVVPDTFGCSQIGVTSVTLTVVDGHGNTNTGTATVTVTDGRVTPPTVVYVDANYAASNACDLVSFPAGGAGTANFIGYNAFATIQAAVNAVAAGGLVNVAAGTYPEQLTLNKQVHLVGPNSGVAGYAVRGAEALIIPPSVLNTASSQREWNTTPIVSIVADGVTVDGFRISGDNPTLAGYSYAGLNVCASLAVNSTANNVVFQNNIIEKVTYTGFASPGDQISPQYTGLVVAGNLFDNIHDLNQVGYGYAMDILGTAGSIINNKVTNTRTGLEIQPYRVVGSAVVVSNNDISVWRMGIYYNYAEVGAGAWTIIGNQIAACLPPVAPTGPVVWEGIRAETMRADGNGGFITSNTVDGTIALTDPNHVWGGFAHAVWGLRYKGGGSDSTNVFFTGNAVQNVSFGFVHDAPANIVLTGNSFSASDSDIQVQQDYSGAGAPLGSGGTGNIDATGGNTYEGIDSTTASLAQLFAIEDKIQHQVDNSALGLVRVRPANIYVTTASGSIQRGLNAASAGDTNNVSAGSFGENLTVSKWVVLAGAGSGNNPASATIITSAAGSTPVISIAAGGTSPTARLELRNLRVTGATGEENPGSGILLTVPGAYYAFDNLVSTGNSGDGLGQDLGSGGNNDIVVTGCAFINNGTAGFRVPTGGSIDGLTVTGTHFDGNQFGLEVFMGSGSGSVFQNVNIANSTFNNNSVKGIYAEKLGNASFSGLTVANSGFGDPHGAGINVNLKFAAYGNIQIADSDIVSCGTGGGPVNGGGVVIEARGTGSDSGSYTGTPASLSNVTLSRLNVTGCPNGIAFGEPGLNNTQPTGVTVIDCGLAGNTTAGLADRLGVSAPSVLAVSNWWNSLTGPSGAANPFGTGDGVSGNVAFSPWLNLGDQDVSTIGFQPATSVNYQPVQLAFSVQPASSRLGVTLPQQPIVQVRDSNGTVTPWANTNVTLTLGSNPGLGVLTGTTVKPAVSGVATYSDLAVALGGGSGFTLVAAAPGLASATSASFDISNTVPVLASLNPAGAVTGSGGGTASVTISGSGFVPTSAVLVDGAPVAATFGSATVLTASLSTVAAGNFSISVSNPPAAGGMSTARSFTVGATPSVVYVDAAYGPGNPGIHAFGYDGFATIQNGVNAVASGGTVNVAAGAYPAVTANKPVTLLGADHGLACGGTGASVINAGPAGTAVTVTAADVTVDGFALQGAAGLSDTGHAGLVVQNNQVTAGAGGLTLQGISGAFTVQNNCINIAAQEIGGTPTIGIFLAALSGSSQSVSGNNVSGPLYGYVLAALNTTFPLAIQGGSITGVMQGVAVVNTLDGANYSPATFTVDGVTMSAFNGTSANSSRNLHAGVYVFTGGANPSAKVTGTITNVTISGTGKISPDSAGIDLADFSAGAGVRQQITVVNCNVSTNKNRGIFASGTNASVTITGATIAGNGYDPIGTGGNPGFGVIARNNAQVSVSQCFIANPAAQASSFGVIALDADANTDLLGPTLTVTDSSIVNNGNGLLAAQSAGTLNASGNWWGTTSDMAIAALTTGVVDFTPYLSTGMDTDPAIGFQGDYSSLKVTALQAQTGSTGRIQEAVNLIADGSLTAGSRLVDVNAGQYAENAALNKSLTVTGPNAAIDPNTGSRVAEAIVVPGTTETSLQGGSTSGTIFRVGSGSGHVDVTIKGLTLDGHNAALTGGRVLNGVEVHTGAGIVNSIGSFDANPNAFDTTMVVQNNIIKNLERYGVLVDNIPSRPGVVGGDISHNLIDNLPSGDNFGGGRGRGVAFEENVYGTCAYNVMTRVNVGWQDDNYNLASPGTGTLVANNTISTYRRGIFHNLQYQEATPAVISGNSIQVATTGDFAASASNFGIELASIQSTVGATVSNNNVTGNVYGIMLWNVPTTGTVTVSGGTLSGNSIGLWATSQDPQFGAATASLGAVVSGVTVVGATGAGIAVDDSSGTAATRLTIQDNTSISGSPLGVHVQGANASALVQNNVASITGNGVGIDVDAGKARIENNNLIGNSVAAIRASNGATVDAGACTGGDITGLGSSTGLNTLTGYGYDNSAPWAIVNNSSTVRAYNNAFGATVGQSLAGVLSGAVSASQSGGLLVTPTLAGSALQCPGEIPAARDTFAGFISLGGVVSATDGVTVTNSDGPVTGTNAPYEGTITRTYTLTDACGQIATATQVFTVDDTTAPVVTVWPADRTLDVNAQCTVAVPDLTTDVTASDNCSGFHVTQNPPANTTFVSLGTTNITVTVADNGGNSTNHIVVLTVIDTSTPPSATFVDDNYAGLPSGTVVKFPNGGGGADHYIGCDAFATIQAGINRAASGGTVNVAAGRYVEELTITNPLALLGPNDSINPNTGTRVAEAVIQPDFSEPSIYANDAVVMLYIGAGNVTIKGLTIDGYNPDLAGAYRSGTNFFNAAEGIADWNGDNSIRIENNIIKNDSYAGVDLESWTTRVPTTNSFVLGNRIENINYNTDGFGFGVLLYANYYAQISDNSLLNVAMGISPQYYYAANPGNLSGQTISSNYISASLLGIWLNQEFVPASTFIIRDNTSVFAPTNGSVLWGLAEWDGIEITSIHEGVTVLATNNIIAGSTSPVGYNTAGYNVWNTPTLSGISIVGGLVSNVSYGVWINNWDGYTSPGDTTRATVSGVTIAGATLAGVYVQDDVRAANGSLVQATVNGNTAIHGAPAGVLVQGANAAAKVVDNPASLTGNAAGIAVDAGKALIQNNDLTGNTVAAIWATNNAVVDAGNCESDVTGLGISAGGNNLSGYLTGPAKAIVNANPGGLPKVLADHDNFGAASVSDVIPGAFAGAVEYSQTTAVIAPPTNVLVACVSDVPAGAVTVPAFQSLGGYISANSPLTVSSSDTTNFVNPPFKGSGVIIRTYTLTDGCSLASHTAQTITFSDTTPPYFTSVLTNITLGADPGECSKSNVTWNATAADGCAPATVVSIPPSGSTFDKGVTTVTNIATDTSGNTATNTFTVTVMDVEAPHFVVVATNTTLVADVNAQALVPDVAGEVVAADNCGSVNLSQFPAAGTPVGLGTTVVTVWAADTSGNSNACTATITVIDTTAPALTVPANVTVTTLQAKDPYATGRATATDANPPVTVSYDDDRSGLTGPNTTGNIVRTWTAVDHAGNVTNQAQVITVVDTNTPYYTSGPTAITTTNDWGVCGAVVSYGPTALDLGYREGFEDPNYVSGNATNNPSTDWNDYNSQVTRVASGTDGIVSRSGAGHGVIDSTAALPADRTGAFSRLGGYSRVFGAGYHVSQDVYINLNDPGVTGATPARGYTWDLSAAANGQDGNFRRDFIFHAAAYDASGVVIAADNGSADTVTNRGPDLRTLANHATITSSGWYTFAWSFRGTNDVLAVDLSVCDTNGVVRFTQTLSDPSDVISTAVGGHRYLWFTFINADKLAIDNTTLERNVPVVSSIASGATFPVGMTTVTNTATDAMGNQTNSTFTVTVNDVEAPVILPIADIMVTNTFGNCAVAVDYAALNATDNCAIASVVATPATGSGFPVGTTLVTVVATDVHGNASTNQFNVTVVDITTTAIASSLNPSIYGQAVTLTATVSACPATTPAGTVTFLDGVVVLGTANLNGAAQATLTLTNLSALTHQISATYQGDAYHVASTSSAVAQVVNPATLTVTGITANNKVYDRTRAAALNLGGATLVGVVPGDDVGLVTTAATGLFDTWNIGTNKLVAISGLTLAGGATSNYLLTQPATAANISSAPLIPSITAGNKPYDGNTSAVITGRSLSGVFSPDDVTLIGGTATFDTSNVGGHTVTATGLSLTGADQGNYALTSTSASASANILSIPLTVRPVDAVRGYGATNPVFTVSYDGFVNGETNGVLGGLLEVTSAADT
ncbi:MAG: HYR domain-containing protein, partial [Verrucomicrobiae bacterium]|nr:HYR domain-containing protein [Verrucomicrobiae bacterium]